MKPAVLIAAVAALTISFCPAQTVSWDFSNPTPAGGGGPFTFASIPAGNTVTAQGYTLNTNGNGSVSFKPSNTLSIDSGYLGMEAPTESDLRIDNAKSNKVNFVLFTFSDTISNVQVETINLAKWGSGPDRDLEYWSGNLDAATLSNQNWINNKSKLSLAGLGIWATDQRAAGDGVISHGPLATHFAGINVLLVGPPSGEHDDAFKLSGLSATLANPVPEPGSLLLALGAAGLVLSRRRRSA